MRRLAFLAAASLAFIAISEPPSAEARKGSCSSGCYDKIAEKYGRPWSYGDLAPADQRSFLKCTKECDASAPKSKSMQGKFKTKKECNRSIKRYEEKSSVQNCSWGCTRCDDGSYVCTNPDKREFNQCDDRFD